MKKIFFPLAAVCIAACTIFISSCSNDAKNGAASSYNADSVKAAIQASNKLYGACFGTGDSTKFAGFYTADACLNPPNNAQVCGSKDIMSFFNGAVKMGIKNINLTTEEVIGNENSVAEIGKYDLIGDKDASLDKGKFIVVWKNDGGKWKMYRDEWNSDNPLPPAAATMPADNK